MLDVSLESPLGDGLPESLEGRDVFEEVFEVGLVGSHGLDLDELRQSILVRLHREME